MDDQTIKKARAGRPTAEQALKRALGPFKASGFDPALIDPRAVLSVIASDPNAPWDSRIAACTVLLDHPAGAALAPQANRTATPDDQTPTDPINQAALQKLRNR